MKCIRFGKIDVKEYLKQRKERKKRMLEKEVRPIYVWMNRFSLILHMILACVLNYVIEAISRHSPIKAWEYMVESPWAFLFNSYMIFGTLLLVYLVRRRVFLRAIISIFWVVLGVINGYMLSVRVTPFNAQDLKVLDDAMSLIDKYLTGVQGVLIVVGTIAVIVWLISMWKRGGLYAGKMYRIPALLVIIVCFGTMGMVTEAAIYHRVVSNYFGNIAFAYEDYGFPYCFSASLFNTGIDQPNGYSEETIAEITENGKLLEGTADSADLPNIIVIQLESFFDTDEVEFFTTSKDPIPTFHSLMQEYSTGYFKVPSVGAGTANTEFEVLTGMNLRYFGPGEYPYKTIAKYQPMESAASALVSLGYGAHALHNNGGNFYSRADVFKNMGFDTYTSEEFMNVLQFTENGWAKDDILTEHITNALDATEQQDFVFGITVEGHGDYPEEKVIENPEIEVYGIEDEGRTNAWEYYVNHLYETDKFIADLISVLEQRGEPTVLVLYGDHLPTMGLEAKDLKSRYLYNTNYAMWDNIGLDKKDQNLSTYQLMASVFDELGIHVGTVFNYHQERRQTKDYLLDLELLQYDMLYGENYLYGGVENAPTIDGQFEMGILDVTLNGFEEFRDEERCAFYGENMTSHSKIYLNGEKQSTIFYNDQHIELEDTILEEGDSIVVSQVGSSSTVFRSSQEYRYQQGKLVLASEYVPPVIEEDSTMDAEGTENSNM